MTKTDPINEQAGADATGGVACDSRSQEPASDGRGTDGRFVAGNVAAVKHRAYSAAAQLELKPWITEVLAQLVDDKGGVNNLSALQRQTIEQGLGPTLVILRTLGENLMADGVLTAKGKRRAAATLYLHQTHTRGRGSEVTKTDPINEQAGADATGGVACDSRSQEPASDGRGTDGRFVAGNVAAVKHRAYSAAAQLELKPWITEVLAQLVDDKGGVNNLSALQRQTIEQGLGPTLVILRTLGENLMADGVLTAKGKRRAAATLYLQVVDRYVRLAQLVGMERQARRAGSLEDYLHNRTRQGADAG